jgi:DNA polymerase (family X)
LIASPSLLRRLRELGAVDAARESTLVRDGILTLNDLELALAERRPAASDPALARAAATIAAQPVSLTLGRSLDLLESLFTTLASRCPELDAIEASGEVRRFEPAVSDLVVVARASDPPAAIGAIANLPLVTKVLHRSGRRLILAFEGHEIDVRVTGGDEFGSVLFSTTGPARHVAQVQHRRGPRLSPTEAEVYAQAGLSYIPPEIRHLPEAFDEALRGETPRLVARQDIRGDLHMHTTDSDGRDSLREMAGASCALGHEYIAITDHSEHAAASRTLSVERLAWQKETIARVRKEFPQLAILHGIEADILPDGSIDAPNEILASLDIVLASLHERADQDGAQLTRRCLQAIRHPYVSAITHPMNQLVGSRPGYDMDYAALYTAAAETGTALEVDGGPGHLDLDGPHARDAVRAGVTLVIDSDGHRARSLERQMRLAVGTARRGGVEPRHVLNTRPLADVRAFLARKRGRL